MLATRYLRSGLVALRRGLMIVSIVSTSLAGWVACGSHSSDPIAPVTDGGGSDASLTADSSAKKTIGAKGGIIEGQGVVVRFPEGAVDRDVEIRVTRLEEAPPSAYTPHSALYRFEPNGLTFRVPVEVEIAASGATAATKVYWTETERRFAPLATVLAPGVVKANVVHFSDGFAGVPAGDPGTCQTTPGGEVLVPNAGGNDLASNGQNFGFAWADGTQRALFFSILDMAGKRIGEPALVTNGVASTPPLVVAGNGGYGVAWTTQDSVRFARFDATGAKVGTDTLVTSTSNVGHVALGFHGGVFDVLWFGRQDGGVDTVQMKHVSASGEASAEMLVTTLPAGAYSPDLLWYGDAYALVWSGRRDTTNEIYFARLNANGTLSGEPVRVTTGNANSQAQDPSVVWTGEHLGVFYVAGAQLRLVRFSPLGQIVDDRLIASPVSTGTTAAWTGSGYGVSTYSSQGVVLHRLNARGEVTAPIKLADAGSYPTVAATTDGYRVVWGRDGQGRPRDLFLSPLLCP